MAVMGPWRVRVDSAGFRTFSAPATPPNAPLRACSRHARPPGPRAPDPGVWSERRTFDRLRDKNRGGRPFSFTDGPITANNPMGVHHAWGRYLKDLFQRYHACSATTSAGRTASTARACGSRSRSRRRWASTRSGRSRRTASIGSRVRAATVCRVPRRAGATVGAPRPVDGLGAVVLHDDRHQHRVHLGLPEGVPRAGLAVHGPPPHAVVSALRHVAVAARAVDRLVPRPDAPVAVRVPAAGPTTDGERCWSGRRRRGRCPPTSAAAVQPDAEYAASRRGRRVCLGRRRARRAVFGKGTGRAPRQGRRAGRAALSRAVRRAARRRQGWSSA